MGREEKKPSTFSEKKIKNRFTGTRDNSTMESKEFDW